MNSFSMYQSSWVRIGGRNWTLAKIKKFDTFLLYQTNAFLMGLITNIDTLHTLNTENLHTITLKMHTLEFFLHTLFSYVFPQ